MYKTKYFKLEELVNPTLYNTIDNNTLWKIFDEKLLKAIDFIREKYGPVFINSNGLTDCGLRQYDCSIGAKFSPHKFGRAFDLHIQSIENQQLNKEDKTKAYNRIREELFLLIDYINFEDNITWLHIDTFNREKRIFNP